MTRRTASRLILLATLVLIAACCVVAAGCSSQAPPYGEIDGEPAEAVWMTEGQLREFDAWARKRAESPQPEQFRTLQIDAVEVFGELQ